MQDVSNGPSKLCDALNITKENTNMKSLLDDDFIWLEGNFNMCNARICK